MGYDDEQGPLLARIYFPATGIFEHHDNSYIRYQSLHAESERTRHVDPESELTYETTEIKVAPNKDITA